MRHFDTLTKRGRARRLRSLARQALESYDLDVTRVRLVNNESNCTFRVDTRDAGSYALRVNLPGMRSAAEIRSELLWQEALWHDTDIPLPRPVRTRTGELVVEARNKRVPEARLCNVSSWVFGRTLSYAKTPENFRKLGVLSARIHAHGRGFQLPAGFAMPTLDTVLPAGRDDVLFDGGQLETLAPPTQQLVLSIRAALEPELGRIYAPGSAPQLIHGDLHWWNVLIYRGHLQPIDFEDYALAFPIQEIAITFFYVLWDERFDELLQAFRAGYESISGWPEQRPGQFELLMGQRALDLLNLLMNSPYAEDKEFLVEFVDIVDRVYRTHFERWRALNS